MEKAVTRNDDHVGWRELLKRDHAAALVLVSLGIWLHAADGLLVATMMPAIIADIGGVNALPWNIALYEIGSIVAGAASGLMTMRYGLRIPMVIAAVVFTAGCLMSASAPAMWVLLSGRLFQGFGGGGLVAMSFVSISTLFPSRLTGRVIAVISALWGVASFSGPMIGAFFVEYASWRAGFQFFAFQAALLAIWVATNRSLNHATVKGSQGEGFPVRRLLWLTAAVASIAWAGVEISAIRTPAFVLLGAGLMAIFVWLDARSGEARLLPRHPADLRNRTSAGLVMVFAFSAATIAIGLYGPLLIIRVHEVSILTAGYILALESIGWSIMAVLVSGLGERHDARMAAIGMTIVAASIFCLARAIPYGPIWFVVLATIMQGSGWGMAWAFILRRATQMAHGDDVQRVSGALPTLQRLGYAFGAAYVGIVANAAGIASMDTVSKASDVAFAVFAAGIVPAVLGLVALRYFVRTD